MHEEVLKNKDKETGMTIHFVTPSLDEGPIVIQKSVKVEENDTVETLKTKVQKLEGEGFIEAINLFADNKIKIEGNKAIIKE